MNTQNLILNRLVCDLSDSLIQNPDLLSKSTQIDLLTSLKKANSELTRSPKEQLSLLVSNLNAITAQIDQLKEWSPELSNAISNLCSLPNMPQ